MMYPDIKDLMSCGTFRLSIYQPIEVEVLYGWNKEREEFNTPWENEIKIKNSKKVGEATIRVSVLSTSQKITSKDICRVIREIFRFYEECRYTLGLKNGQSSLRVIVQDDYIRKWDGEVERDGIHGDPIRGEVLGEFPNAQVIISVKGCKKTIKDYEARFRERHPEDKWTLPGMVFYVIAHEIAHLFSPDLTHSYLFSSKPREQIKEEIKAKSEILAILYGSTFAFKKGYIKVPQGDFLKQYWSVLGINLSSKDEQAKRETNLKRCENEIRDWLIKYRG